MWVDTRVDVRTGIPPLTVMTAALANKPSAAMPIPPSVQFAAQNPRRQAYPSTKMPVPAQPQSTWAARICSTQPATSSHQARSGQ